MSLGTQATQLWKRSRPFRFSSIAAVLMTVLAVVTGQSWNNNTSPPQQNNPTQNNTVTPNNQQVNSQGGGGSSQQAMVQCGPAGSTQLAAPLVVGNSQPRNVTAVQPSTNQAQGGVPLAVIGRFNQFIVKVDAAKVEPRRGESCALMEGALAILEAGDRAYDTCFQDATSKLRDAESCANTHSASEQRYDALLATHTAFSSEPSSSNIAALALAQSDMTDYDKARERWREVMPIITEARAASASIAESDIRIERLVGAANAARSGGAAEVEKLAAAAALDQLDIARLTPEQEAMLDAARAARSTVQDSDRRLDALAVAVQSIAGGSSDVRAELISAVGALTPLDVARADPTQTQTIARARSEAARFALNDLVAEARGLSLATASAEQHQRLVDLAAIVTSHGGITEPTPEHTAALSLSNEAAAALARSDRRLATMSATTETVRAGGPSAMGEDVLKSYDAITDFDKSRMTEDQKFEFDALRKAREVTITSREGELTRAVPIFVSAEGAGPTNEALRAFYDGLQRDGFNLVDTLEASAVHLKLRVGELRDQDNKVGNITVKTARIDIGLSGEWTIADDLLFSTSSEGVGRGRDALDEALNASIDALIQAVQNEAAGG
ncbi:hypothetical protein [uncultured Roseobacter sp.]|uniref:hypothetical protein n=1 Tax=uncultured Roseobacter sp. TaxID=114847 RepID=UPI00261DF67E|nr:hypothetical protein [uncultured Roseobacter sp.]